ncbi:MAG: hypothetical protein WCS56_05610 [Bacilli bacterium]
MILMDGTTLVFLILALCIVVPCFILLIVALIIRVVKAGKKDSKYKELLKTHDSEDIKNAFGAGNIQKVTMEGNRITVTVKDTEKVNTTVLQDMGIEGVLIVGSTIKLVVKKGTANVYKLIKDVK